MKNITFVKALRGGAIAGLLGVGLNNIWSLVANALGATIPPGFALATTVSSLFPVVVASVIYFLLVRFSEKGYLLWLAVSIAFTLISFYPVFTTTQLPDGTIVDETFPLLAAPMHVISGFLAVWGIPRWSK
jgi:hypothetical protein